MTTYRNAIEATSNAKQAVWNLAAQAYHNGNSGEQTRLYKIADDLQAALDDLLKMEAGSEKIIDDAAKAETARLLIQPLQYSPE